MVRMKQVAAIAIVGTLFGSATFGQTAGVRAECKLLEVAFKTTKASVGTARSDILSGCPGYEDWPITMTKRDDSRAFRKAASTKLPAEAKAAGKAGKILFRRMISRGVPPEIATHVAAKKEFAAAVSAFGK